MNGAQCSLVTPKLRLAVVAPWMIRIVIENGAVAGSFVSNDPWDSVPQAEHRGAHHPGLIVLVRHVLEDQLAV